MSGESVLIVEDDATLRRGLKDNFELRGYVVNHAEDGDAGLETALSVKPDLIVLDIMLPGLNGFEICRRIREAELDMPIIMLTAKGQEEDIVRGLNLGADDYMTKPFSVQELLARAAAFLRRRKASAPQEFAFGDCRLDLRSHRLFRDGTEVALSPKEFRLLELFVQRAGRALTRDEIMRCVWGSDVMVTSRSVDRCVTTLRSKIEPDARRPMYVQTIRDVGYRFELAESEAGQEASPGPSAGQAGPLAVGTRLGPYAIHSLLGSGGMGEVYRARDERLERDVAIKVLPHHLAQNANALTRFKRETKAIAALSHRTILSIYDVGTDRDRTYAVMELLEGQTLQELLQHGTIEWRQAVRIAIAIAEGLSAAHAKEIVHRDIKPSNIFLTSDTAVKILDFGLARVEEDAVASSTPDASTVSLRTDPGSMLGTVGYMSPEQIRGQATDERSDLFSLGCVIYEMLAGAGPFARATSADTLAAALKEEPDLSRLPDAVPADLRSIVRKSLQADPERRYRAARDLAFALEGVDLT
ncbi:MAG: protein kinase [bacterium]|nr:protein kinase [bacterium]